MSSWILWAKKTIPLQEGYHPQATRLTQYKLFSLLPCRFLRSGISLLVFHDNYAACRYARLAEGPAVERLRADVFIALVITREPVGQF